MTDHRFFDVSGIEPEEGSFVLTGPEFHHLAHVTRRATGDEVMLLDGQGGIYRARIAGITANEAVLEIVSSERRAGQPHIDMALAVTRAARLDFAVEKCSELGVGSFIPVVSERSIWCRM